MNGEAKITIPLSLADIYNALCPDCQQRVVDLVSAKAGPDFVRKAVAAQLAGGSPPTGPVAPVPACWPEQP